MTTSRGEACRGGTSRSRPPADVLHEGGRLLTPVTRYCSRIGERILRHPARSGGHRPPGTPDRDQPERGVHDEERDGLGDGRGPAAEVSQRRIARRLGIDRPPGPTGRPPAGSMLDPPEPVMRQVPARVAPHQGPAHDRDPARSRPRRLRGAGEAAPARHAPARADPPAGAAATPPPGGPARPGRAESRPPGGGSTPWCRSSPARAPRRRGRSFDMSAESLLEAPRSSAGTGALWRRRCAT